MRRTARFSKCFVLVVGIGVLVVVALTIAPGGGRAQPDGGYLEFTGPSSGWMEVPDDPALNPTDAITVEAWIYLNSYTGWGASPDPFDCPMLVAKNWEMSYALSLGCGGDVMDSFVNGIEYFENVPTIPLNTWTHVAMTYDGATRRNFQDGIAITDVSGPAGPIGNTTDALRIGNDVSWDFSPNGRIDDIRIWDMARTPAEIAAGMNGVPSDAPGLVVHWTFDGGSLVDSASAFTGTLVGNVQVGFATPSPTPTPVPVGSPGDANCDGRFDTKDPIYLLAKEAAVATPAPCPSNIFTLEPGDEECDGDVDIFDVLAMMRHLSGLLTGWGCPSPCQSFTPTPISTGPTPTDRPRPPCA